jgi:hypothetical protein
VRKIREIKKPTRRSAFLSDESDYCLAAGAEASAAGAEASAAGAAAGAEASAAEQQPEPKLQPEQQQPEQPCQRREQQLLLLPQAARATAASRDAIRRDFFIVRPLTFNNENRR